MPSENAIRDGFNLLRASGARPPAELDQPDGLAAALGTWAIILDGVEDEEFRACLLGYMRGPQSAYWPTPGALLAHRVVTPPVLTDTMRVARDRTLRAQAAELWHGVILRAARDSTHPPEHYSPDPHLDAAIRFGIRAAGGLHAIGQQPIDQLHHLKREAVEAIVAQLGERQALTLCRPVDGAVSR